MQSLAKVQAEGGSVEIKVDVWKCGCDELLSRYGIKEGSRIRVLGRVWMV